jgi:hypothetical protein
MRSRAVMPVNETGSLAARFMGGIVHKATHCSSATPKAFAAALHFPHSGEQTFDHHGSIQESRRPGGTDSLGLTYYSHYRPQYQGAFKFIRRCPLICQLVTVCSNALMFLY